MEYKVLTIMQPWASLLVHGVKKIETRPKPTSWTKEKGVYLIHAAQKWTMEQEDICLTEPFKSELEKLGYEPLYYSMSLGQIIGSIEVKEVCSIAKNHDNSVLYFSVDNCLAKWVNVKSPELSFGDYRDGRYAWLCENPRILKYPISYKGGQGYYQNFKGDKSQLIFL